MFNELNNKLHAWNQYKSDVFHNNILRDNISGKYIWELTDNGYYLTRDTGSYFLSNNGEIHTLNKTGNSYDWDCHLKLYQLTKNSNIRIDIPVSYDIINGLHYKIYHRPNKEFGTDYHIDIFEGLVNQKYFLEYIDNVNDLLMCFKQLNTNLPIIGMTPMKRFRDNKGYFFTDFKQWTISLTEYINRSLVSFDTVLNYLKHNQIVDLDNDKLLDIAKGKWNII